jgi:hypothetical protein
VGAICICRFDDNLREWLDGWQITWSIANRGT